MTTQDSTTAAMAFDDAINSVDVDAFDQLATADELSIFSHLSIEAP